MNFAYRLLAASAAASALLMPCAFAQTPLNYTTSWIGNSFGYGDGKWMQLDVEAIAVAPDGTVYTNAPWDESGSEIGVYARGDKLAVGGNTHGWGAAGGDAIAVNSTYVYAAMSIGNQNNTLRGSDYAPAGSTWFGVTRRLRSNVAKGAPFAGGIGNSANVTKNSFLRVTVAPSAADAAVRGLAATDTELYVADTYDNQIVVYDAQTMRQLRSWTVPSPGRIAIDSDSTLWVVQGMQSPTGPTVAHYDANGAALPGAPALPAGTMPADVAIAPSGQLAIADDGAQQLILLYNKSASGQTQLASTLGTRDGIFHTVKGVPGDWRFNGITGIGFDQAGNLYVAQNGQGLRPFGSSLVGQGAVLEAYRGLTRASMWRLYGLTFVDAAAFDPASTANVYTGSKLFTLDYRQSAGKEWSYAAFTLDRFDYPDDPAFHMARGVRGSPMVRRFNGGLFLYTLDEYAHYLNVYRFSPSTEGDVAIPAGLFAQNPLPGNWPQGQPTYGEWMWRDANGDGRVNAAEITSNPSTGSTVGDGYWWVDAPGNVWLATPKSGIREMPLQGLDAHGNPQYTYASARMFPMPAPFTRIARIVYDAASDTMYVTGFTAAIPWDSTHWKEAGPVLARYDHWSAGTLTPTYTVSLPWNTTGNPQVTTVGIAVAGNYVFIAELYTQRIDVYDARNGQYVGAMTPGASVGNTSGWVDIYMGISAAQRDTGEYVVLVEDDARAKILMYRWTPGQ
ncbi:hypothetical protein C7408_102217 [Paraburkholderia caballeronis]|nr:hypothetical protein C7408_102217 [Paraburkholderia caballeronis]TDV22072.1 hypothetical protein C7406_101217 [Paraburkholderia caballeronis]TDV28976.1 hypothetical protein C7404_102218 [Paraburkholderia caballeronis]